MSRFDVFFEVIEKRPTPEPWYAFGRRPDGERRPFRGGIYIETARGKVVINPRTGLVDSYEVDGKEYLKPGAFAVEVFNDTYNCWDGRPFFNPRQPIGHFTPMSPGQATDFAGVKGSLVQPVRITDDGEVNVVVEADLQYNLSRMLVRYIIHKITGVLEVELRVFYAESEKRLKLNIPTTLESSEYMGQTIFGREKLRADYWEVLSQYWQAVADDENAVAIIDDGVYGSHCFEGTVGLSLVRSAGYGAGRSAWGEPFHENLYQQRMDQGERRYRFRLEVGKKDEVLSKIDRSAAQFNQKAYPLAFCPSGEGIKPASLVSIDRDNISLSCFKQSERDASVYILRLFECQGIASTATIEIPIANVTLTATFAPFEIKTYKLENGCVTECDMLEGAVPLHS